MYHKTLNSIVVPYLSLARKYCNLSFLSVLGSICVRLVGFMALFRLMCRTLEFRARGGFGSCEDRDLTASPT
ncbi:hypothetical protein Scep_024451 [Stephania cephalantha]|uniref:Uncharacterized protein n=1 Tax=Stephania cephalantha TaxID=152367 RepID=A0AAP0EXT0_9MAGN